MIDFFEALEAAHGGEGGDAAAANLSFLSTHPATGERLELLRAKLEAMEERRFTAVDFDLESFKQRLRDATAGEAGEPASE